MVKAAADRLGGKIAGNRLVLDDEAFGALRELLHRMSGIVLEEGKRAMVQARVFGRLLALGLADFREYLEVLRDDASGRELVQLIDAISTNVTHFFREEDHFVLLRDLVARRAAEGRGRLRFWSAACSSGEEPYSMAMMLREADPEGVLDLKILATDIGTHVLESARRGVYAAAAARRVPQPLRERYLEGIGGGAAPAFAVRAELKDLIMFRRLNLSRFPYPIRGVFDVIFCRNVMFYFDRDLRERMVREFEGLLRPGGHLFVGQSETLIGISSEFRNVGTAVYRLGN